MTLAFPVPSEEAIKHSLALIDSIKQRIKKNNGPIPFSDYMQHVLYASGLGYYSSGNTKIGPTGDFITAPEISPVFAQCLARQCQQILASVSNPIIMELGAGLGSLAADVLMALERENCLPIEYWILEPSAELQERQAKHIQDHCSHLFFKVKWLRSLPTQNFNGVILANEVIDALAVSRFIVKNDQIIELGVQYNNDRFEWAELHKRNPLLFDRVEAVQKAVGKLPEGYCSEINLYLTDWLQAIAQQLHQGAAIWIDYGYPRSTYYHPARSSGTLTCYYRHLAHHNPFLYPGLQDITTHVDFTALAEAGLAAGLTLAGYCNQAVFLTNCGLIEHINHVDVSEQARIKKLISPLHMGESFKVMALSRNLTIELLGFQGLQEHHRL